MAVSMRMMLGMGLKQGWKLLLISCRAVVALPVLLPLKRGRRDWLKIEAALPVLLPLCKSGRRVFCKIETFYIYVLPFSLSCLKM